MKVADLFENRYSKIRWERGYAECLRDPSADVLFLLKKYPSYTQDDKNDFIDGFNACLANKGLKAHGKIYHNDLSADKVAYSEFRRDAK